jgi:hypothetical protein
MRQPLLAAALLLLSASDLASQTRERDGAVPLPQAVPNCTKPCVLMRIAGMDGRPLAVVLQTTPARPLIASADPTGRLVVTTPVSVAVPGDVERVRIVVQSRHSVRVTFDDGGPVELELNPVRIWGSDILLVRGDHGFTPMVQYHQLQPSAPSSTP